jgi:hypothetical protein
MAPFDAIDVSRANLDLFHALKPGVAQRGGSQYCQLLPVMGCSGVSARRGMAGEAQVGICLGLGGKNQVILVPSLVGNLVERIMDIMTAAACHQRPVGKTADYGGT